jgi:hypothetical protein
MQDARDSKDDSAAMRRSVASARGFGGRSSHGQAEAAGLIYMAAWRHTFVERAPSPRRYETR